MQSSPTSPSTWAELLLARAAAAPDQPAFEFSVDGETAGPQLTYADLDRSARVVAAAMARLAEPVGARALLLCPPGQAFVAALYGCFHAGAVAVPSPPPGVRASPRLLPRFRAVLADARPSFVLTTSALLPAVRELASAVVESAGLHWILVDALDAGIANEWRAPAIGPEALALLQYTSGSTAAPKGVMVTHANLLHNCAQIDRAYGICGPGSRSLSWLPPYHDMGLVGGLLAPVFAGIPTTLMPPSAFIQQPVKWLRAITRTKATLSGGPNFAYEVCLRRVTAEQRAELDLRHWRVAYNGAEPVRAETLLRFSEAFACCGFRSNAFAPCYGLAEATLFVTGVPADDFPTLRAIRASTLEPGREAEFLPDDSGAKVAVACGRADVEQRVIIVDPVSGTMSKSRQVGEIWVQGPGIARGYFGRADESRQVFEGICPDVGDGAFLRTGDLGFLDGDQLFVTGRLKDLIIVRGGNHYPQDLELTAAQCHPALQPDGCAAFAIDSQGEERLALVAELARRGRDTEPAAIFAAVRRSIVEAHGVDVDAIAVIAPGTLPRTTSGKVQRHACRARLADGGLDVVAQWRAATPAGAAKSDAAFGTPVDGPDVAAIRRWLVDRLAADLGTTAEAIDPREPFARYGLDSLKAVALAGDLETWLGRRLPATLAYDYPTVEELARHLGGDAPDAAADPLPTPPGAGDDEPIAIIGIGCRLPMASDAEAFWRLLADGIDAVREVPPERWDAAAFYDADAAVPGKTNSRWGGFLDAVDRFDAQFFGISPHEAARMDPQQRLLLEVATEAIDDAGMPRERLAGSRSGVFIGIATGDYSQWQWRDPALIDGYASTGNAFSIAANRISYVFDLHGPSLAVDTACSSSLVAVHLACESLRRGECVLALAGGVNAILSPGVAIGFTKAGVTSPDGHCKAFDSRANGYVRGEGAAVVVLKRLSAAIADGDRIHAVIRGSAVNQDGRTNGILAPSRAAQESVLREAYARARVDPADVQYVEAHGTGTLLGDPIEATALGAVVGASRRDGEPCLIGSVKSNLGHLEAAAGVAGLVKVALSLRERLIPPSLHYREANPHIAFDALRLRVATTVGPWPAPSRPLLAGVSSFGFGGTNAHAVLEEPPRPPPPAPRADRNGAGHLMPISARTPEALKALAARFARHLADAAESPDLHDLCHTAGVRRTHHEHRLAVAATTRAELAERLAAFGDAPVDVPVGRPTHGGLPSVVFVFPGQGSQSIGMGRDLLLAEPIFRDAIEACDRATAAFQTWSLLEEFTDSTRNPNLDDIEVIQPMLFALQVALAALWRSWGIEPAAVVGHSLGEVAAAHVAGALTLADAARVVCLRSQLLRKLRGAGGMVATELSPEAAAAFIGTYGGRVSVAAYNSSSSTVLAGEAAALDDVVVELTRRQVFCRRLIANVPSHSRGAEPLRDDLARALDGLTPISTRLPFVSSVAGRRIDGEAIDARYWWQNLRQPVLFSSAVNELLDAGHRVFVELSPHPALLSALQQVCDERGVAATLVPSLRRETAGPAALRGSVAALYGAGCNLRWEELCPGPARIVSLPAYPWQRERCWIDAGPPSGLRTGSVGAPTGRGGLPGSYFRPAGSALHYWETEIDVRTLPIAAQHRVQRAAMVPAAAFIELVLAAIAQIDGPGPRELADVEFHRALFVAEAEPRRLQLALDESSFSVRSRACSAAADEPWTLHASGTLLRGGTDDAAVAPIPSLEDARSRCSEPVSLATFYDAMARRGIEYGPALHCIGGIWRNDDEAVARLQPPAAGATAVEHSAALLDGCLQLITAVAGAVVGSTDASPYLPTRVDRVKSTAVSAEGGWALAGAASPVDVASGETRADVYRFDDAGRLMIALQGVCLTRLDGEAALSASGVPPVPFLYKLHWQQSVPPAATVAAVPPGQAGPQRWLVLADRCGTGEAVAARLADRGDRVVVCHAEQDVAEALAEAAGDAHELAGVVLLSSLDTLPAGTDAEPPPGDSVARQCGLAADTVRTLVTSTWRAAPRLWIVTRGAQAVDPVGAPIAIAQAGVGGLGRAITLEHPQLRCVRIDLDPTIDAVSAAADSVCAELDRGHDGEDEVALRRGMRYVRRLRRHPQPDRSRHLFAALRERLHGAGRTATASRAPRVGEVEIAVAAAGVNFRDVLLATGVDGNGGPGFECAGTVTRVGEGVDGLTVGDAVVALASDAFAPFVTARAAFVLPLPAGLDFVDAATVPVAFLTAWYGLHRLAHVAPGERVLIHSASGGVGLAAVQIARRAGAEIFATAGSAERHAFLEAQGVIRVYSSRTTEFVDAIRSATGGAGVDIVVNSLPGRFLTASLGLLAPYGRFVEIGRTDIARNAQLGLSPFARNLSFSALDLDRLARDRPGVVREVFAEVLAAFRAGDLAPLPRRVFGVDDVDQALEYMTTRRHIGKIVIDYAPAAGSGAGSPGARVRSDATYLVTGGLGGVGLAIAEWLVGRGARHLLLIGRHPPTAVAAAIVGRLEAAGARVVVRLADVTSGTELGTALDELRRTMPPLRGVVHAAGVIDDATLVQLDRDRLARVLAPKVVGARNLHRMTLDDPLDVFVLCSSAASVLGSPGQASYCAANAFMDALAHERRREGRPATAVNWGPWRDVGLAATAERSGRLAVYGIRGLPPASALAAMDIAFAGDETQIVVLDADWARFREAVGAAAPVSSLLAELAPTDADAPSRQAAAPSAAAILAVDPTQRPASVTGYLQDRCARVLGLPVGRLDAERPLGAFGLDSLMAVQLKNHIERDLGVVVPIVTLVQGPSIAQLGAQLLELLAGGDGSASVPSPSASGGAFPLTPEQERIWFADRLDPGNPAFKVPVGIRLDGPLDAGALQRSLREVVLRHEALRTTFVEIEGVPMQVVGPGSAGEVPTFDVSHLPANEREAEARRIAVAEVQRPLDLATGPLFGAAIIRLNADSHVLVMAPHHIIGDGWSLAVLIGEIAALYAAFEQGGPSPLAAPAQQFREFVRRHRLRQQQRQALDDVGYWRRTLADPPPLLDLPTDRPRPQFQRFGGTSLTRDLPADLVTRVDALARSERCTRFMALLAALYVLLERYSGQQDLVVGSPVAGRDYPGSEGVIGLVANVLALRADLSGDPTFRQLLARVRTLALDAYAHQDVPFRRVVEAVQPPRHTTYPPLFQVMLTNPPPLTVSSAGSLALSPFEFSSGMAVFDLLLMVVEGPDGLSARLEGSADLFDATTVAGMLDAYGAILTRAAGEPETRLSQFELPDTLAPKVTATAVPPPTAQIAIASTFAIDPLGDVLEFWQDELALDARIEIAPFNQVFQQLLDPAGLLAANRSGANVLLVRADDWSDDLDRNADEFARALSAAAARSSVSHVVCACPPATRLPGSDDATARLDALLTAAIGAVPGVQLITAAQVAARYPVPVEAPAADAALAPGSALTFTAIGTIVARQIHALGTPRAKVVAVDCDDTLWRGTCGEDGADGLVVDAACAAFQAALVALSRNGVLVCLCSRNNEADVFEVFDRRADMVVRREHLAAWRINWHDKADNLIALSEVLNVGLDSFVFVDDDPLVCEGVRTRCPEVVTIERPATAQQHAALLDHVWVLDGVSATAEDALRTAFYRQEAQRQQAKDAAPDLAAFLAGLRLTVTIAPLRPDQIPRASQLTWRTNQFNTTTIRRTEPEMSQLIAQPANLCLGIEVTDRFGAYGLVGLIVARVGSGQLEVDSLLLSCRALGRGVEHRALAHVARLAAAQGLATVEVRFEPTAKNRPALDFLRQLPGASPRRCGDATVFSIASDVLIVATPSAPPPVAARPPAPRGGRPTGADARRIARIATDFQRVEPIQQAVDTWRDRRSTPARPGRRVAARTPTEQVLARLWTRVLHVDDVGIDDNFFDLGGHSFLAARLVHELRQATRVDVPLRQLFERPTIRGLAAALDGGIGAGHDDADRSDLAADATLNAEIQPRESVAPVVAVPRRILLTGATGFLGAFVLAELLEHTDAVIHCLVRASDDADGWRRLATQFDAWGLGSERLQSRVVPVVGDLGQPELGLAATTFAALAGGVDVIYHVGALVNFAYPYSTLRAANVYGTREVLRLACAARPKPLHYVSTLGVLGNAATRGADGRLAECDASDRYDGVPIGYFESKWVAERLVTTARARGLPVTIFRPGIIGGDTQYGRCPATDLLAQLIQLIARLRSAPDVEFALDIAPVDYVARAIVHASRRPAAMGRTFHVCGAAPTRFGDLTAWIEACGSPLRRLPLAAWLDELAQDAPDRLPLAALVDFTGAAGSVPAYDDRNLIDALAGSGINCPPIDGPLVARYVQHLSPAPPVPAR